MKYRRKENVVARSVAGAHLLVPVHGCTRSVFTLNAVGCRLWEWIAEPRTEDDLAIALAEQYGISSETARHDVQAFLGDMVRLELAEAQD